MTNLDKKCDLCSGWGLIEKNNSSHILCPRCEIKKIDDLDKKIQEKIDRLENAVPNTADTLKIIEPSDSDKTEKAAYADPQPSESPIVLASEGTGMNGKVLNSIAPIPLPVKKRGRPKKEDK